MKRQKISKAMDYLDEQLIADAEKSGGSSMKKISMWKKWTALAASLVLMVGIVAVVALQFAVPSSAVIALDVNPSIELEVDRDGTVDEVIAINDDAKSVVAGLALEDKPYEEAVNEIVKSMNEKGYLTEAENSILISVDAKGRTAEKLKKTISDKVSSLLAGKNISASVMTQSYKHEDAKDGISSAKAALIKRITDYALTTADGVPYTKETLSTLKVHELKLILESKGIELEGIEYSGKASEAGFVGQDAALDAAFAAALAKYSVARESAERIEIELDFEDDIRRMVYEIEFVSAGFEYEYDIDAELGTILSEERELDDEDDDDIIPEGSISKNDAINAALAHAKIERANVRELDAEFESGSWEVEFDYEGCEYEYKINPTSGEVLSFKSERD